MLINVLNVSKHFSFHLKDKLLLNQYFVVAGFYFVEYYSCVIKFVALALGCRPWIASTKVGLFPWSLLSKNSF